MPDLVRIKGNVRKMLDMNAPEADIDAYIAEEGVTVEDIRNFQGGPKIAPTSTIPSELDQQPQSTIPDMLAGMDRLGPEPVEAPEKTAMDWFKGGSPTVLEEADQKATAIRNKKAQAGYEALPGYLKPLQAASDLLTVGARLPASMLTGAAALVSPGEYKSITPEDVIARLRTGKTEGPEFEAEVARQKQIYEDAAYRSGWAGTGAQIAATAGLPVAKIFGAGKPFANLMATGGAAGGAAAAGSERDPLMGMATGAAGTLAGSALGKGISYVGDKALGVLGKVLPVGPLKIPPPPKVMTADDFNALAKQKFLEAESHGVVFNKQGLIHLRDRIRQELVDKGYHPKNQPGLAATLETLDDYIATGAATQRGMQTLREMTSGGYQFMNKKNNMLVAKVINEIDDLGTKLDPKFVSSTSSNPKAAGAAAKAGRDAYRTKAQLQEINSLVERGRLQGDTNISKNVRQSVRKQVAKLIDPTRPIGRGYTPLQKEAIKKAVSTTTTQDIAHGLSGLMPRDKLSAAISLGTLGSGAVGGFMLGGPAGAALAVPAMAARFGLGIAAEKWANRMAEKSVNELVRVISTGQTSREAAQSVLQRLAASKRQAVMQGLARVGYSLAAATQPFNQETEQKAQ